MNSDSEKTAGLLAEFQDSSDLIAAATDLRNQSLIAMDAFTPFPVAGLAHALGRKPSALPWWVLFGGLLGGGSMYLLAWWVSVVAYPLNIGGRPLRSWPSFIPPTFEALVLGAAFGAIAGVLYLCGLPRLHHPVFEVERFRAASTDAFSLWIPNPQRDALSEVRKQLQSQSPAEIWEVPRSV